MLDVKGEGVRSLPLQRLPHPPVEKLKVAVGVAGVAEILDRKLLERKLPDVNHGILRYSLVQHPPSQQKAETGLN